MTEEQLRVIYDLLLKVSDDETMPALEDKGQSYEFLWGVVTGLIVDREYGTFPLTVDDETRIREWITARLAGKIPLFLKLL